jgi:ribosomal protein S18 acetylase RimI-like enzyme
MSAPTSLFANSPAPMRLRFAEPTDLDNACELLQACIAGMRAQGIDQWDDVYPNRQVFSADIQAKELSVCEDDSGLLGLIVLNGFQDPEYLDVSWTLTQEPIGVIHRLMVHPRAQGRGVARSLMVHAEEWARNRGFASLRLDAFTENPRALRLYPALGYRQAGEIRLRKGRFLVFEKDLTGPSSTRSL